MGIYNGGVKYFFPSVMFLVLILTPLSLGAETYAPLTTIPAFKEAAGAAETGNFAQFINVLYRMSIGLASALAVLVIVWAGIQYSVSVAVGTKENMRHRITMALGGLVLLIGAYMLLEVVNPQLTELKVGNKDELNGFEVSTSTFIRG